MAASERTRSVRGMRAQLETFIRRYGDVVLAAALTAVALIQVVALDLPPGESLAAAAMFVLLGAATAVRVRYPEALLLGLPLLSAVGILLPKRLGDIESIGLFVLLAVYSGAAHTGGRRTFAAGSLTVVLFLVSLLGDPESTNVSGVVFFGLALGAPWVAGRAVRRRRLNERRLEQEKEAAEAAIEEERARIARELHDVVAHAISVIVLQARAGRKVFASKPDESLGSFDTIERTGTQALEEMRRLLGMLRAPDDELALAPQPSLARLDALVEQVRRAGLPVELTVDGTPVDLPPGIDLSAYRIVQEALTNALKHAGPARARVLVRYEGEDLTLEITDDGLGTGDGGGTGHGLVGVRERVEVFGGELETGHRDEGGYTLRARLPLSTARA
jgi:signal transduction histidine kinase